MIRRTRQNSAVLLAGISALMPLGAHSQGQPAPPPDSAVPFAPSGQPLILTRTVRRELPGGKEIVAVRSYAIQIRPGTDGYVISGHLIDSRVEAPEQLAALASIERNRPDSGLFPILLDQQGRITGIGTQPSRPALQDAAKVVMAAVDRKLDDPAAKAQAAAFVGHVRENGASSAWPDDLFHPHSRSQSHTSEVSSDAGPGQVSVAIEAATSADDGLMQRFVRTVTTELGGTKRTASEEWTLSPAG